MGGRKSGCKGSTGSEDNPAVVVLKPRNTKLVTVTHLLSTAS